MTKVVDWPRFTPWTWILASLLAIILLLMWMVGLRGGCCNVVHAPAAAPAVVAAAAAPPAPVAAPPAAVPPVAVSKVEDVKCGASITASVTFASASAKLDDAGKKLVTAIGSCLKDGHYEIGGYTDSSGNEAINTALSQKRADAVKAVIVADAGVPEANLTAIGFGSAKPLADNTTDEGKAKNRRIEFVKK